jgi:GNAT superfamily N-acetyltransferase
MQKSCRSSRNEYEIKKTDCFDQAFLKDIAKRSQSQQACRDVEYMRVVKFRNPECYVCFLYKDIGFLCGGLYKGGLRIACVAVDKQYQGMGIAKALVQQAAIYGRARGAKKIYTRTKSGYGFYRKLGFRMVGYKGDDYLLEYLL